MKTFKDTETGLEWLLEDFGPMTWKEAMKLDVEGFKLPTRDQLLTLIDDSIMEPSCSKPVDILSNSYWSSTPYVVDTDFVWSIFFYAGNIHINPKTSSSYVRLVRTINQEIDENI